MKYAVISDVHANLQALEAVLKDAEAQGAQKVVCLGDIVGYGPLPAETLRRVRSSAGTILAGNHDDAVSGRISADNFIDLAADAVKRHQQALSDDELKWLKSLPYTAELEGAIATHGDFTNPPAFNYMMDGATVSANLKVTDFQLMFVGHTHVPGVYLVGNSGNIYNIDPEDFTLESHKRYIVNPGSVGYPRENKGQCYSSYVLYDSTLHTIQFRFLPFTVASVMQRGENPKAIKKKLIAFSMIAAALVSGLLAFLCAPSEETVYEDDPALTITNKIITIPKTAKHVKAGLTIAEGGPVLLRTIFLTKDGSEVSHVDETVSKSRDRRMNIPNFTYGVEFVVRRLYKNTDPKIESLSPSWE